MIDFRLLWHLLLAPAAGSAVGALLYGAAIRPLLPWPGWILDVVAVTCGSAGLLAGGILSFRWAPWGATRRAEAQPNRARCVPLRTASFSAVAVAAAAILAGVPSLTWPIVAAGIIGGAAACFAVGRFGIGRRGRRA